MELTGSQSIPAPPAAVWDALVDPAVLQRCLPGCESVEKTAADEFKVVMASTIGPLRIRFTGVLRLTETRPPQSCVMVFEGHGGAAGYGKGIARVQLHDGGLTTELDYAAKVEVGGKLAQVGSRLIDGVARKMSVDFFEALRGQLAVTDAAGAKRTPLPARSIWPAKVSAWLWIAVALAGAVAAAVYLR